MSPRAYSMARRSEAVESTREKILSAAVSLYREKGIRETTAGEVAERADVARATVLNHFGNGDALAAAAIETIVASLSLPSEAIFKATTGPAQRIRRLVAALFDLYDRGEPWFTAFGGDMRSVRALRRRERRFWKDLDRLYEIALGPRARNRRFRATVVGLTSPPTLGALRQAGLSTTEAASAVADLLVRQLDAR